MNVLDTVSFVLHDVLPSASVIAILPAAIWVLSGADKPTKWWVFVVPALVCIAILLGTDGWDAFTAWWSQDAFAPARPTADAESMVGAIWHQLQLRAIGVSVGYAVGVILLWWWQGE